MIINNALRKRIKKLLPKNYRKTVVDRLKLKGTVIHPNTVRNVLNGSSNMEVALEILKLYEEHKRSYDAFNELADTIIANPTDVAA